MANPKVIIIGASSGIGEALAKQYSENGYEIGITARRIERLEALAKKLPTKTYIRKMDVAQHDNARSILSELIAEMGDVEIIILNAAIGIDKSFEWENEKRLIDINVSGFIALFGITWAYFEKRNSGHIVGISSIGSLKGFSQSSSYFSSKAFISNYMQGMRQRLNQRKLGFSITDIRPGFVATEMTEKNKNMFWVASADKAATQIITAIQKKKGVAYITKRWNIIAWIMQAIPDKLFVKLPS